MEFIFRDPFSGHKISISVLRGHRRVCAHNDGTVHHYFNFVLFQFSSPRFFVAVKRTGFIVRLL